MEEKQVVKIQEGKLCRWQLCGDCTYFVPNEYDKTGELGNCGLWMKRHNNSPGPSIKVYDDACEYFE